MKTLDLRTIPSVLINLDSQPKRLASVTGRLKEVGIEFERVSGVQTDRGIVGCGLSHHQVLSQIKPGTLVFEDDVVFTEEWNPILEIPDEVDAVYLGASRWGRLPFDPTTSFNNCVVASQYTSSWKRIFNMCSTHAILYLNEDFIKAASKIIATCLNENIPFDLGMAKIQKDFIVLAPNKPMVYQEELPTHTFVTLEV
jgi:hypothetical protein